MWQNHSQNTASGSFRSFFPPVPYATPVTGTRGSHRRLNAPTGTLRHPVFFSLYKIRYRHDGLQTHFHTAAYQNTLSTHRRCHLVHTHLRLPHPVYGHLLQAHPLKLRFLHRDTKTSDSSVSLCPEGVLHISCPAGKFIRQDHRCPLERCKWLRYKIRCRCVDHDTAISFFLWYIVKIYL